MLGKASGLPADELIIDLEDAVAPSAKDEARALVVDSVGSAAFAGKRPGVRVNAPRSRWCHLDIAAIGAAPGAVGTLVVSKVEGLRRLAFVDRLLATARFADRRLRRPHRLARPPPPPTSIYAARANGLQAIDGPHLGVAVDSDFEAAVARARDLGFDGKWAIHPSQPEHLNEAFSPTAAELSWARAVLDALEAAEREGGRGAVALEGEMLDEAVGAAARRILARA
ncbi:MAG: CoA ester lyase [Actinobacteria bacterium]|nr:CoA ester lyase [Actinomycetota bacterium]